MERIYVDGGVYVIRPGTFRQCLMVVSLNALGYIMLSKRNADIDDGMDFICAEA